MIQWDINMIYPLVMTNGLLLKMAIEIVDVPIKNGDFPMKNCDFPMKNGDFPIDSMVDLSIVMLIYQRVAMLV